MPDLSQSAVAIITARGGSKRIPRKNLRPFLGRPIIAYPIEAALASGLFGEVMVSTDDVEIAAIARSLGAKVPFMRSAKNSDDFSTTADVLQEVLTAYRARGESFHEACCLYPTAPFIRPETLRASHAAFKAADAGSLIPVVRFSPAIQRALKVDKGRLSFVWPEHSSKRSQDLPATYHDSGQFYWLNVARFLEQKTVFMADSAPFEVGASECQDIDTEADWELAELKFKALLGSHPRPPRPA